MSIWDDDNVSEYDLVQEDAQEAEALAEEYGVDYDELSTIVEAGEDELQEIQEESVFNLSEQESNTIYNARLRLEQAKLYEMLITHDLFEGVDVIPEAIEKVQNELKFFIVKRLELLLGLREPVVRSKPSLSENFNELEVDFLKQLAFKGTFGQTKGEKQPSAQPAQRIQPKQGLNTLKPKTVPKQVLQNPAKKIEKQQVKPQEVVQKVVKREQKPQSKNKAVVSTKPAAPAKKIEKPTISSGGMVKRNLTQEEIDQLAVNDLRETPKKPFHKMTAKEKAARIKEVQEKHKRKVAPTNTMPQPSPDELQMKYMLQQQNNSGNKGVGAFNNMLANILANKKNQEE